MEIPERTGCRNRTFWEWNCHRELCPQLSQNKCYEAARIQQKLQKSSKTSRKPCTVDSFPRFTNPLPAQSSVRETSYNVQSRKTHIIF